MRQRERWKHPGLRLLSGGLVLHFCLLAFAPPNSISEPSHFKRMLPTLPITGLVRFDDPPTPSPTVPSEPTASQTPTPTASSTPTQTVQVTPIPTDDQELTPTSTLTSTPTPTETPTQTSSPTPGNTPFPPRTIVINEVAWAGTLASANDEWIELFNTSNSPIDLTGWILTDGGDIHITLQGSIPSRGYFLLERTDDSTITDIGADQIYTGSLRNSGESLRLQDPSNTLIDSANGNGGSWPAGEASTRRSMERSGGADQDGNWGSFTGRGGAGHDAAGNPIQGTPKQKNSVLLPPPASTATPPSTPTPTPPAEASSTPHPQRFIMINEIAWAGTVYSSGDEWIELYNPNHFPLDLAGWSLTDSGDVAVQLSGSIAPKGYFLLERTDDSTIADIQADQIYNGGLNNSGETLTLADPSGAIIDSANAEGGAWLAGSSSTRASMEREGGPDIPGNWETFTGHYGAGHDTGGNPIRGTPGKSNSILQPIPAPTWIPGTIRINEVLIKPHYDWEGKGNVDSGDEFIELINIGPRAVFLKGWYLDDIPAGGSNPYKIRQGITLRPGSMIAFFNTSTHIALNDSGDTIRLLDPSGNVVDEITYLRVSAYNLSYGRLPDGSGTMKYGLWPTPSEPNILFEDTFIPPNTGLPVLCPDPGRPITFLMRHVRHPAQARWMRAHGYAICD